MFPFSKVILIYCVLVMGAALNIPKRCEIADNECKRVMYQTIVRQAADGIPKYNVPSVDPLSLENVVSALPNSVKLILEDGAATGFKNCVFDKLQTYLEEPFHTTVNLTCNLQINGKYKVEVPKPVMEDLGGEDLTNDVITGSGTGKVTFENLHVFVMVPFDFEWRDKDIYLRTKNIKAHHDAHDKVALSFEDLDVGNKVNGEKISNYLKDHAVELNLIDPLIEKLSIFFNIFMEKYVSQNPAKDLFTSDLSSFM